MKFPITKSQNTNEEVSFQINQENLILGNSDKTSNGKKLVINKIEMKIIGLDLKAIFNQD